MKLNKISLEFTADELESIHYAMEIGIRQYKKDKSSVATDWIEKAEEIRKKLPIATRLN